MAFLMSSAVARRVAEKAPMKAERAVNVVTACVPASMCLGVGGMEAAGEEAQPAPRIVATHPHTHPHTQRTTPSKHPLFPRAITRTQCGRTCKEPRGGRQARGDGAGEDAAEGAAEDGVAEDGDVVVAGIVLWFWVWFGGAVWLGVGQVIDSIRRRPEHTLKPRDPPVLLAHNKTLSFSHTRGQAGC